MSCSSHTSFLARGRLAVLSAHIAASSGDLSAVLEASPVLAQEIAGAPVNVGGSLMVIDQRTGKKYEIKVSDEGTVTATDFKKITTGKNHKGLKLYDPGYLNTAPVRSSITYIDGVEGILRYRGYPIEELAESSSFVEVAYLLLYGNLPSHSQLTDWEFTISQHSAVPQGILDIIQTMPQTMPHDAYPESVFVTTMSALSVFHPDANPALRGQDLYKSKQVRDKQIARILGKAPTIAAAAYLRLAGRSPVLPSNNLSYSENFLYMLNSLGDRDYKPNPRLARVLDILFILHADHEMNCSTAAARHLSSSGADVYTALAGALGAMYGPFHGGAIEDVLKMLNEIRTVENIPEFIESVKNRKRKLSGFGHRVYKGYDPRAKVVCKLAEEVFSIVGRDPLVEVSAALEKAAMSDEYFVKRKLYPNTDFYSGLVYKAMGIPPFMLATNLQYNNDTLSRKLDKLSKEVEDLKKRENHLTFEMGEIIHEVKSCEAEIENLLNDIHITTINAATFEEKMFELLLRCESLEISSMIQKEMFYEEISRRSLYEDELKEKLDEMDRENGGLKEELSAYFPLVWSLRDFINSLEQRILLLSNHQFMRNCQDEAGSQPFQQKKSNQEGDEDHCDISSVGILELQKLHAKVNALEQVVIDILGHLEHDRYVSVLQAAEIESEGLTSKGTKYQEEMPMGKDIILHLKKKEETGIMKDIQLDHVLSLSRNDNGAKSLSPSAFGSDETNDQIMELWEAIDGNKMEKPSMVTSERDLECHPIEAVEEEKSICHASKPAYVKELSIDKIEVTSGAELHQEWSGNISERLSSDAQRLSVLQKSAQDLKRNMESSDLSIAPTSFEFKQVKAQLKEADAVILQLIDTNRLTRKAEKLSMSSGSLLSEQMDEMGDTSEMKKSERALRGSEKIGRLELELQKLEYIWLKLKEEHDYEKARAADRRTRVRLRDYLYGRRDSPRRMKSHFCSCIRPRTKDE